jgi:exodeoxyribonuclease VII small subunit
MSEMPNTPDRDPQPASAGFEEALAQLERIVHELEEGKIPLAEGLARYEQGVRLLKQCYQQLAEVERRIEVLNRVDVAGRAHCEPFDDEALSIEEKAQARSRRRTRDNSRDDPPSDDMDGAPRLF